MPEPALDLLRNTFGYQAFRGDQEAVIDTVTRGGDALVLMPTGGGKSLCYQIPALLRPGTGIVVSPLIALMQDQVAALRELGVRAAFLNSTLDAGRGAARSNGSCSRGELDLLYVAPSACCSRAHAGPARSAPRSRCSRSTRRIACRSGGTISARSTCSWRCCTSAFPACRASR